MKEQSIRDELRRLHAIATGPRVELSAVEWGAYIAQADASIEMDLLIRAHLPALLDELDRLEAEVERLRADLDTANALIPEYVERCRTLGILAGVDPDRI